MRTLTDFCIIRLILFSGPALAQRGKWWQDERFGREQSLDPAKPYERRRVVRRMKSAQIGSA